MSAGTVWVIVTILMGLIATLSAVRVMRRRGASGDVSVPFWKGDSRSGAWGSADAETHHRVRAVLRGKDAPVLPEDAAVARELLDRYERSRRAIRRVVLALAVLAGLNVLLALLVNAERVVFVGFFVFALAWMLLLMRQLAALVERGRRMYDL